jgi:hypothetical protein
LTCAPFQGGIGGAMPEPDAPSLTPEPHDVPAGASASGDPPLPLDVAAAAPPPVGRSTGATSTLAVLTGLMTLAIFAFFASSVVAVGMRWARGPESHPPTRQGTSAPAPPQPSAEPAPERRGASAKVVVPPAYTTGIMRVAPSQGAAAVAQVPAGTIVELGASKTTPGRTKPDTWYQVRTTVQGKPVQGWMHADILRPE